MGTANWDKVISYLRTTKAKPEKVLNMLKTIYGKKSGQESDYEVVRNSWAYIVIGSLANKMGPRIKRKKYLSHKLLGTGLNQKTIKRPGACSIKRKLKIKN